MSQIQAFNLNQYHFFIQIIDGAGKGQSFRIFPPRVVIGRGPECNIQINDNKVSRVQFEIHFKPEGLVIEDKALKGTTVVNKKSVQTHILQHKDIIHIGDTQIQFNIHDPQAQITGANRNFEVIQGQGKSTDAEKKQKSPMFYFLAVVILLLVGLLLVTSTETKEPIKLKTQEEIQKEIEESEKIKNDILQRQSQISALQQESKKEAQKHFIRGFRDYQNEQYSRSLEAFRTSLSLDPDHTMSKRYKTLANKKRQELIDHQMELGEKYRSKQMYDRCAAAFESVLYIINNRKVNKYQLAREKMLECQLLKGGNQ